MFRTDYLPSEFTDNASLSVQGGRGSKIGKFFRGIAHGVERAASQAVGAVGHELTNQAVKSAVNALASNAVEDAPEVAMAAAGVHHFHRHIHHRDKMESEMFEKLLNHHMEHHKGKGGFFNFKKIAKDAYHHAKKFVKNEYDRNIKPNLAAVGQHIEGRARATLNEGYKQLKPDLARVGEHLEKKAKEGLNMGYSHLKNKVHEAFGIQDEPAAIMEASGARMKKPKQKRQLSARQIKRNQLVREIMKKTGCSLPETSRHIKQHNLI